MMLHNQATEHILDIIDKVRASSSGSHFNQRGFYEKLFASLPQFVVCGPQSSGKSSALHRVSGISLSEASTFVHPDRDATASKRCPATEKADDSLLDLVPRVGPQTATEELKGSINCAFQLRVTKLPPALCRSSPTPDFRVC